jgi:hypothetical protein
MPLFHGLDVAHSQAQSMAEVAPVFWLMLGFFVLPMFSILGILFTHAKLFRRLQFGLTVIYTLLNFFHLVADLMVQPIAYYQIALMVILLLIGLLLNLVSWQWIKTGRVKLAG